MSSVENTTEKYILIGSHAIEPRKGIVTAALEIAAYVSYALTEPDC